MLAHQYGTTNVFSSAVNNPPILGSPRALSHSLVQDGVQVTLTELCQTHRFELCGSIYTGIFFLQTHTIVLHDLQLFKKLCSRNVEPQMQRPICKMTCQFSTVWGLVPQFPHFAGSTVHTSFYISVPESLIFWEVLSCKWGSHAYGIKFDFFL